MGLKKTIEKLDSYFSRLEDGKATKIKPSHVEKVISKLRAKQALLQDEIDASEKQSQKERLERKLSIAVDQIKRAEWLLKKIDSRSEP